ncbi:MAG: hypothetical protein NC252_11375 [Roseburia sp.]|nr:hypothetical protein [Roseburia sp.]
MKRCNYLFAAAFAAMFAACSDDNGLDEKVAGPQWNEDGTGYVSLSINLPTQPSTRAANDDFDDGMPSEYSVNDATLILFTNGSDDEKTAEFNSAYKLSTSSWNNVNDDPNQITTTTQITQKINSVTEDNLYALIVLNCGDLMEIKDTELYINSESMLDKSFDTK